MQRIQSIELPQAQGRTRELLETVEKAFGIVPNATKVMANSPAVLDSFLALSTAMGGSQIGHKLHHQIKLATSEANTCDYCSSILTHVGEQNGFSVCEIQDGRRASSSDPRTDAALKFSAAVLETHGKVTDDDIHAVRQAGFNDGEIVEIVASVVAGCFTNFLNNVANTTLDVLQAEPQQVCSTGNSCDCH